MEIVFFSFFVFTFLLEGVENNENSIVRYKNDDGMKGEISAKMISIYP